MKNLMIYTGGGWSNEEDEKLARIQIDNSLDLGWRREDILLFTDFPYEHSGVVALRVPDGVSYEQDKKANKIKVVAYLLNNDLLDKYELYWCHDLDAFELNNVADIDLSGKSMGIVPYYYKKEWSFSNFFFYANLETEASMVYFAWAIDKYRFKSRGNEKTFRFLVESRKLDMTRFKELNVTYHIAKRCLRTIYPVADKPIKVLHFRPSDKDKLMPDTALNMFMYGKNSLKTPLMTDRLISIFKQHGIQ